MTTTECIPATIARQVAKVLVHRPLGGGKWELTLEAPGLARVAQPGHFVQLDCHPELTLRRPFSIRNADPAAGRVELFYKVVGKGTRYLSGWQMGGRADLLGPIGTPFDLESLPARALLVAGGIGIAPIEFLARRLVAAGVKVTLLLGWEGDPPWPLKPATAPIPGVSPEISAQFAHWQWMNIPGRLASVAPRPGCFEGLVTGLAALYLRGAASSILDSTRLFGCGPPRMLEALSGLAEEFGLAGEFSLEEHMACGFGGCVGCVAKIRDEAAALGWSYRRVCVDGPVFPVSRVLWG